MEKCSSEEVFGPPRLALFRVFTRFLRIGVVAWGGPTAQIAHLHREFVERERWVDERRFRRALAVYQALPGPEAHELCCWLGMLARGRLGSIAAGLGFMMPGLLLMLVAAGLYMRFGVVGGAVGGAFVATQAAVIGLILRATIRLVPSLAHGALLGAVALLAGCAQLLSVPFWLPLLIGGGAQALAASRWKRGAAPLLVLGLITVLAVGSFHSMPASIAASGRSLTVDPPSMARLGTTGLLGGLLSFGGAYTAIPVVHDIAVGNATTGGWMTEGQFLDALAIGGVLPAPLVIFGTFVGFLGGGLPGALLFTLGMFLPAFSFTALGHGIIDRMVNEPRLHAFLDGLAASVAGLIAVTTIQLLAACVGFAVEQGTGGLVASLERPGSLVTALLVCAALFLLRKAWAVPAVLAAAAAAGAVWASL
jgi:chromate transporter